MPVYYTPSGFKVSHRQRQNRINLTTGTYNATIDDDIIIADATNNSIVITLPAPAKVGTVLYTIRAKAIGTGRSITVNVEGGAQIDGASSKTLTANTCYCIYCNGTSYETLYAFTVS